MAVTALDPKTALIVVDLQKGIAAYPTNQPLGEVALRAGALAKTFRAKGLPVVLVAAVGLAPGRTEQSRPMGEWPADFADIMPELDEQPSDHKVTKRTWGAFSYTDLDAHLKGLGVTQVVIVGVASSAGVESTARQAHELGFNVTLAIDAMTDMTPEAHDYSVTRIFPRIGETGLTADIVDLLSQTRSA
jgi:nicotinamidase-related amidase